MKTFIALLSVSLIALAVAQSGTGLPPTSTTASTYTWTAGCAYVTAWTSTQTFAYCGGCATGYYQNATQSNCTSISTSLPSLTNCVAVSSFNTSACLACATGFYLSSGACVACAITGATACSSATTATAAAPGYFLNGTTPTNCLNATGGTSVSGCAQCDPSGSNVCIACASNNWVNTTSSSTACVTSGYITGCYQGTTTCAVAAPGYFIATGSTPATVGTGITNCTLYGNSATNCTKAAIGYMATSGTVSVCTTVSTTVGSTCSGPASGYYVNGTAIVALPISVATGTASTNYTCTNGYYLTQTGLCLSGSFTDTNCAIGNSTSVCVGCKSGYYFSTNLTCGACGTNCGTCTNSSICTACSNTTLYTLNSNGTCTNKTSSANILAPSFAILSMIFYYLF
jgi:hypothetical protein